MHVARAPVSWILLVAMLVSLPGIASGRFLCTLGMKEAGPACPLCQGRASADQPGPAVGNSCCKFVTGQSVADSYLPMAQVQKPDAAQAPSLPADVGLGFLVAPDRDLTARANQLAAARTPYSGYLSTSLRL